MTTKANDIRRSLPKMDKMLACPQLIDLAGIHGNQLVKQAARKTLDDLRNQLADGITPNLAQNNICQMVEQQLIRLQTPSLRRVINGSGVVIHTNLGRSPLPKEAEAALLDTAWGYSNLEFDLDTGERGERYSHVEELICELTGAEAAIVVNNNAAAVMLALSCLASEREVIVSRGELVEIGGSFRIPDVMAQSGARLVEVGTTNRTHCRDYQTAINEQTTLLLKVHTSNFAVVGFTNQVSTSELSRIAQNANLPVMVDAGSGCLVDLTRFGIEGEDTVQQYLQAGADIVTFSGDKLLGGPQAGLIAGKKELISRMKKFQLLRALRIDKLTLAALEATLRLYRNEQTALERIPTLRMLTMPLEQITTKARRMQRKLRRLLPESVKLRIVTGCSSPGGGTFPLLQLPSQLIELELPGISAAKLEERLRHTRPPVVGRVQKDRFMLDLRTLSDHELPMLADALLQTMQEPA